MCEYESVIICHKNYDKLKLQNEIWRILRHIKEYNDLGLKQLAYDLQGQNQGEYIQIIWQGYQEDVTKLENILRPNNYVLKFITMKEFRRKLK